MIVKKIINNPTEDFNFPPQGTFGEVIKKDEEEKEFLVKWSIYNKYKNNRTWIKYEQVEIINNKEPEDASYYRFW